MSTTIKDGEPFSPAKIHPLLSPQSTKRCSEPNAAGASGLRALNDHTHPDSPQPPQTSVHCPQDVLCYASTVATAEVGGATAVIGSDPNPTVVTPDGAAQDDHSAAISTSSSIENLSTLPRVPSFGEHRIRKHRKNACSIDSAIPRQTLLKALQSRPPTSAQSMDTVIMDGQKEQAKTQRSKSITHQRLADALSDLNLSDDLAVSKMAALASPCFFHKKFDKAVNLGKVLEEMSEDDTISHSRLMQTASSVREVSKQLQRRPIKMTVRNVMIVTKARDNNLVYLTRELAEWLLTTSRYGSDVGVNVYVDHKLRKSKRFDAASLLAKDERFKSMLRWWTPDLCWESPEMFDLVLTLGGDGTVLFTSWLFQRIVPPILSFSLGSLGFLTNFEFAQYQPALDKIMTETGMRVNLRMRFTCTVYRYQKNAAPGSQHIEAEQFEVLNELVIDRGPSPYVSNLELYGDNNLLTVVQADGVIFSTPTGSTAYSLSAGGSLVHPDIPAILLTPICPHTLSFRPMLLNDSMLLRIAVPTRSRATAYCAFDGKGRVELRQGDHVTIAASQYPFPTVLSQPTEWFDSISRTLRWNSRGATQKAWDGDENADEQEAKEPDFDIDFDNDDVDRDSGYSADGSTVDGRGSPIRKGMILPFP
ncbi:NAD(+) kinase [Coniothyrium glycines]